MWMGEGSAGDVVDFKFTTRGTTGAPTTLSGTPALSVYKSNSTTESTAGVTLTADFDSRTGLNHVHITTASDGTFYADGSDFQVVITTGTVGGTSVVGEVVGHFTLRNRAGLKPTVAGRTLDVSAGGEAGIDLANVGSPTTTLNLSGLTIAAVSGAVGSVTAGVTVTTNNDKTGYSLSQAFPSNFSALGISAGGNILVVNTLTTYTGNTPQTGDNYARIGVAGVGLTNLGDARIANLDVTVGSRLATAGYTAPLSAAGVRTALGMATNNLDTQLAGIDADVLTRLADASYTAPPSAASIATAVRTTAFTESYAAAGAAPTLEQFQFMLWSFLQSFVIAGTTYTAKKLDGSTTSMTFTLNDATNPSAITRAT